MKRIDGYLLLFLFVSSSSEFINMLPTNNIRLTIKYLLLNVTIMDFWLQSFSCKKFCELRLLKLDQFAVMLESAVE